MVYRIALLLSVSLLAVSIGMTARAQSPQLRMETIPFDETSAEGRSFVDRRLDERSRILRDRVSELPDELFFGLLDIEAGESRSRAIASGLDINGARLLDAARDNTEFDDQNMTWFHTDYRPVVNADIFCGWRIDSDVDPIEDAAQREAELENSLRTRPDASSEPPPIPDEFRDDIEFDGELTDFSELTHEFTLAGARCVATMMCEDPSTKDTCNRDFLETLASMMTVVQRGNR